MTRIRVGAAVLNQTPLDWHGNLQNVLAAIGAARPKEVRILCLPELCITGYGCEDAFHSLGMQRSVLESLNEIVPATRGMIVSVGLPLLHRNALFNCACLLVDGRIAGFVAKRFLAGEGIHYEPRWFKAWPQGLRDTITLDGRPHPIGDLIFDCGGVKIGFEICEDAWVARRPAGNMALEQVDLILNPSASHFAFGKHETRKRIVIEGSRAFNVSYIYANLLGNEAGRIIYDGDALIASGGSLLAAGSRFSFQPLELTTAVIDVTATRMAQARSGSFQPDLAGSHENQVVCEFPFPDIEPEVSQPKIAAWETGANVKEEEFARAVALGLFDYMRKSRSRGFVVNLSGGADSSSTACLVAMMTRFALSELGAEQFRETLRHIPDLPREAEPRAYVGRLLFCLYQATKNSSEATRHAATSLAEFLGASMACLQIDSLVQHYVGDMENVLGRKLTWQADDIPLQNIQARVRGPSAWLLANVRGSLLLSTSNRSEAAVGYATMDGDTCGGLSPIAGIDKAYLRQWLRWVQHEGPAGFGPVPVLSEVNELPPTAELRPRESKQTDEADLMPYEVLDAIERSAIRDKQLPLEVFRVMRSRFPEYTTDQLHLWVQRFFLLWCRNQWKRERYAPSFHLDDENLDPKSWCRFPILSGNFQRELEELREYVQAASD
ncbi:MAG: NAD(+) synthase [Pirellulales bacterium]|nr:NAD(+) synthase [Pirellulales bacterium]